MRSLMVVAMLCSSWVRAESAVLLFPVIGTPQQVVFHGRVLKHAPSSGSSTLSKNLRSLTASNWVGAPVEVRYAGRSVQGVSGHDGNFQLTMKAGERPFEMGLSAAECMVQGGPTAMATVDIVGGQAPFLVISDFDDTVAVSNVVSSTGLVKSALLQDETTQPVVEGMSAFYECLGADKTFRPGFALVSGSPVQYLGRVRKFLSDHRFPVFGLYLRDLGPTTLKNYKQPVIRALLQALPNDVVLVGDSGESDPEVYREIKTEFSSRVKAIYIRAASKKADKPSRFEGMTLFSEPRQAALDAVQKGLVTPSCIERVFTTTVQP